MSINKLLYGVENPSRTRIVVTYTLLVLTALMIWGGIATFIPSENWSKAGSRVSIIISVFVVFVFWWAVFKDKMTTRIYVGFSKKLALCLVGAPLIWLLFQGSIVYGAPALITMSFGSEFEDRGRFKKVYRYSRRSCDYRLRGEKIEKAFLPYICVSEADFHSFPMNVDLVLEGYKTYFGFLLVSAHEKHANKPI